MTIGIIGSGAIGTAFARTLSRAGIEATISNSRGPKSLKDLVRELGPTIKAGTREDAARADIVFVAVNWTKLPAALANLPEWKRRVVIDANNPIEAPSVQTGRSQGPGIERGALPIWCPERVWSRRSTISTLTFLLQRHTRTVAGACCSIRATTAPRRPEIAGLIEQIGFYGIDLGSLAVGGKLAQFPGGPLPNQNLIKVD